jgi:MoaA/NifB/PqqE/SkfB family radical SAM enzyme
VSDRRLALKIAAQNARRGVQFYSHNRSFSAWLQIARFGYRKLRGLAPPETAALGLTDRCQLRCAHCYSATGGRDRRPEWSTRAMIGVLDQFKALGALQVLFTGGEPLLREDVFELVAHAHRLGLLTRISTNGEFLTDDVVAKLKCSGLNQCGVSIDDADPEVHDRGRGKPGTFAMAVQGLRRLRAHKIESRIITTASREKVVQGLEKIVALGRELKVNSVYVTIPFISGRWTNAFEETLSEDEMVRLRSLLRHPSVIMEFPTSGTRCCAFDRNFVFVNTRGDVTPCPAVPFVIGDLRSESLTCIWRRHIKMLTLESLGKCPMGEPHSRESLRAHVDAVRERGPVRPVAP